MKPTDVTGTYTYRSFLNKPAVVGNFNDLQFAEAELTLVANLEGKITGVLSWPTKDDDSERAFMNVDGELVERDPALIRLHAVGAQGSAIETFEYRYELTLAKRWPETTNGRTCLVGSVIRVKDHGSAKAGVTASVIAVQRDFLEPRDIAGVALAPSTIAMLASKWHRLWHATWHTVRGEWPNLKPATQDEITKLGWKVARPPRMKKADGSKLILDEGAGEDFLFMHRWMIAMVRADYEGQKLAPPASWKRLPPPDVAQIVYTPVQSSGEPLVFRKDLQASGNMVPSTGDWVKTPDYFATVMRQWEANYTSAAVLASLSLGALGNLLEFTIHNAMHNRWLTPARDPDTGELIVDPTTGQPGERPPFDFSDKWNAPNYDYLGEFYSSHVHPVFWRLHGWVDDRIDDWFKAQDASRPGSIKRRQLHGVDWFEVNAPWVIAPEPFVGVSLDAHSGHSHGSGASHEPHHGSHDSQAAEIETMLKVMAAIENDGKQADIMSMEASERRLPPRGRVSMRFEMPDSL